MEIDIDNIELPDGLFYGGFPFEGTRLCDGKVEKVSGNVAWKTVGGNGRSKKRTVGAAMCIHKYFGPVPGGAVILDRESVRLLNDGDRKTQKSFLESLNSNWKNKGYDIRCV